MPKLWIDRYLANSAYLVDATTIAEKYKGGLCTLQ